MKIHIPTGWRRLKKIDKIRTTDKFSTTSDTTRRIGDWSPVYKFDVGRTEPEVNNRSIETYIFIRKKTQFRR